MTISGSIEAIGVSGRYWMGGEEQSANNLLNRTLASAQNSIRISSYSLGNKSNELDTIFSILKEKTETGVTVQLILNKYWTTTKYVKRQLSNMHPSNFYLINYQPKDGVENLHAKIIVVDSKKILIGSANISKSGLFSNHEVVLRIDGGEFATKINRLLDVLAESIRREAVG